MKLLEENIREKLHDSGFGNNFLDVISKAQATKAKIDKWDNKQRLLFIKGHNQHSEKTTYESESYSVVPDSLQAHGLYSPWNSPGQYTGVGSLSLFQGIFPTQRSNPGLLHCRQILYQLRHKASPRILEWVASPFSRGSSQPKDWTWVSRIVGRCFMIWATREASPWG